MDNPYLLLIGNSFATLSTFMQTFLAHQSDRVLAASAGENEMVSGRSFDLTREAEIVIPDTPAGQFSESSYGVYGTGSWVPGSTISKRSLGFQFITR